MELTHLDPVDVGVRLRGAREAARLTQTDVATDLRVARTTLVAMEQGRRRVRTDELQRLARLYGTSVNALLRREAVHVDLAHRFRKLWTTSDESIERAACLMNDLVRAEVELENLLGVTRTRNYPPARPLLPGDVHLQAENNAIELRQWLGLAMAPVRDVMSLLQLDLGVRLYVRPLDSQISGLSAYDDNVGACILLNANHPPAWQAQTAVHELGHLTSRRQTANVCRSDPRNDSREEGYANAFGRSFLTPAAAALDAGLLVDLRLRRVVQVQVLPVGDVGHGAAPEVGEAPVALVLHPELQARDHLLDDAKSAMSMPVAQAVTHGASWQK